MWENMTPSTELPHDFCAGIGPLQLGVVLVTTYYETRINSWFNTKRIKELLETVFFNFQTNRERKIENKKFGRKKRFPQFLLCMYVCVCIYLCVCLSVRALQTSSFNIGGWNFDIDTYMWISQNGIFYFFKVLLIFRVIPLFQFLQFSLF